MEQNGVGWSKVPRRGAERKGGFGSAGEWECCGVGRRKKRRNHKLAEPGAELGMWPAVGRCS